MKIGFPKIVKYESCWGIKLGSFNNVVWELWFCPPKYEIKPHSHPNQRIKLTFLFGEAMFVRCVKYTEKLIENGDSALVKGFKHFGRTFTIEPYHTHWFAVSNKWLVFFNREEYLNGAKPTSASIDLLPS